MITCFIPRCVGILIYQFEQSLDYDHYCCEE